MKRKYNDEFKQSAVALVLEQNCPTKQAAENLGVHPTTLKQWVREYRSKHGTAKLMAGADWSRRVVELERENRQLRLERDILKNLRRSLPRNRRKTRMAEGPSGGVFFGGEVHGVGGEPQRVSGLGKTSAKRPGAAARGTACADCGDSCGQSLHNPHLRRACLHSSFGASRFSRPSVSTRSTTSGGTSRKMPPAPTPAGDGGVADLSRRASEFYERAVAAQRAGDWTRYGEELTRLGVVLRQLQAATGRER